MGAAPCRDAAGQDAFDGATEGGSFSFPQLLKDVEVSVRLPSEW